MGKRQRDILIAKTNPTTSAVVRGSGLCLHLDSFYRFIYDMSFLVKISVEVSSHVVFELPLLLLALSSSSSFLLKSAL